MTHPAYLTFPAVHGDTIVFVAEDDLWARTGAEGSAHRLTAGRGVVSHPVVSPDGTKVAFLSTEEGLRDVYEMPLAGGEWTRLTFDGLVRCLVGYDLQGRLIYSTGQKRAHGLKDARAHVIEPPNAEGVVVHGMLDWGPATSLAFRADGTVVMGWHAVDLAKWKRYRGGRRGRFWIRVGLGDAISDSDEADGSDWSALPDLGGSVIAPMWLGDRLYFLSDHDYDAQLYSCLADGSDVTCHSSHADHAPRHARTDGTRIVYCVAGDIWSFEPGGEPAKLEISIVGAAAQRRRRFINPINYVESGALHPAGHTVVLTVRGRPFVAGNWEGAVYQLGARQGVRYRLSQYLHDGQRVLAVSDATGPEDLVIFDLSDPDLTRPSKRIPLDGRPISLHTNPRNDTVAVVMADHRLVLIDLESNASIDIAKGAAVIAGADWAPDGRWLAYGKPVGSNGMRSSLELYDTTNGTITAITDGRFRDVKPSFDPDGELLLFLSYREFDPVYDSHFFQVNFPRGSKPFAVTLRANTPHPFWQQPRPLKPTPPKKEPAKKVVIDLEGIASRIVPFPAADSKYLQVKATGAGVALFVRSPVQGSLNRTWRTMGPPPATNQLVHWDSEKFEIKVLNSQTSSILDTDAGGLTMLVRAGGRLRITGGRPSKAQQDDLKKVTGPMKRKQGFFNLSRIRLEVDPAEEWKQMFHEVHRMFRDFFWTADMSGVDWEASRDRFAALLPRIRSRAEFSDMVQCWLGDLGTSHAYEMGGDPRPRPTIRLGRLGIEATWDDGAWRIDEILEGEPGSTSQGSPIRVPGVDIAVGDRIVAVDGEPVSAQKPLPSQLSHRSGTFVSLATQRGEDTVVSEVRPLTSETALRYRQWVKDNTEYVHSKTDGAVGYVHIPNMGPTGFAEFHRTFLSEWDRPALLVDVRYNGGGHVSQLLLDRLGRKRWGYVVPRHGQPSPYPRNTPQGPLAALTNELAGSDGDIFSHVWKLMELGPLIGTRTWGGVIGISPRHRLVDNGIVTQPEFSNWFVDVGFGVENYGTDPDVVVEQSPSDFESGRDRQLDAGIATLLSMLDEAAPPHTFAERPNLGR